MPEPVAISISGPAAKIIETVGRVAEALLKHSMTYRETMSQKNRDREDRIRLRMLDTFVRITEKPWIDAGVLSKWEDDKDPSP